MTPQQQADKIKEIYNDTMTRLEELGNEREGLIVERQEIIKKYIKELEIQKVSAIRQSLGLSDSE